MSCKVQRELQSIESGGDPWLTPYAPLQERRWPNPNPNVFSAVNRNRHRRILNLLHVQNIQKLCR